MYTYYFMITCSDLWLLLIFEAIDVIILYIDIDCIYLSNPRDINRLELIDIDINTNKIVNRYRDGNSSLNLNRGWYLD